MVVSLLALLPLVLSYSRLERDRGEACMKLCMLYYSEGDRDVWELQGLRRDLDPRQLEDRVLTDMFMWCFERMQKSDVVDAIKANSREDLDGMAKYIHLDRSKYLQDRLDLTITREETELREAALSSRVRVLPADLQGTREALRYAAKLQADL